MRNHYEQPFCYRPYSHWTLLNNVKGQMGNWLPNLDIQAHTFACAELSLAPINRDA
jgi:hypothetical protein